MRKFNVIYINFARLIGELHVRKVLSDEFIEDLTRFMLC